jgi:serine phosphatase RsbU (regulator of sigma subunit)
VPAAPALKTLDYAGACIQARQVGGDYYDFLNLGQDRFGLVLGDIAGKGIADVGALREAFSVAVRMSPH